MKNDLGIHKDILEFDDHRLVVSIFDPKRNLQGYIALHRGGIYKPAFGATRVWKYSSEMEALRDVLKLSRIMSYKSALAGFNYGGAKAVLFDIPSNARNRMLVSYTGFINCLGGHFYTGADVGLTLQEVKMMRRHSKYIVGVYSDPVKYTVLGLAAGIDVCLHEVFGTDKISGRTFAIQGLGKVGFELLRYVNEHGGYSIATDINASACQKAKAVYPKTKIVNYTDIYNVKVDVFSPCALSNALNSHIVHKLRCNIIVGSANCQLENFEIGKKLHALGILYAPDYIVNAGGFISVVDEYEHGNSKVKRVTEKVLHIKQTLCHIIEISKRKRRAVSIVADEIAKRISDRFV